MKLVIIDYGAGNVFSVLNACKYLGYNPVLTDNPITIKEADKIIFPGVGSASNAMQVLNTKGLGDVISKLEQPILGICLGMQLFFEHSQEGDQQGLSIIPGNIIRFQPKNSLRIPHMGWNRVALKPSILWNGLPESSYFYFVHSYHLPSHLYSIGDCYYGTELTAAIQFQNYYGVQFHPEKSDKNGLLVLKNFIELT